MKKVLELPAFRRLLVAAVLNELAFSVASVALALLVYHRTGSAIGAAAFFLCAEFAPAFVSPFVVARLDQAPAREGLTLLYGAEVPLFAALAWLVHRFALPAVLALALLDGVLVGAARALARATWTALTSPVGELRAANAMINGAYQVCFMVGPGLGGAIVAVAGAREALLVDAVAVAIASLTIVTSKRLPLAASDRVPNAGRLRAAIARVRWEPTIRRLLGLEALGIVFFTMSIPVEVVLAQHTLHAGAGGYGVLLAGWGAGAIIGSVIYARWRTLPSRVLMALGSALLGAGFLVMSIAPVLGMAIVGAAIAGLGNGIQVVAMRTALQEAVPEQSMALILSLNESMFQAAPGVGIVLGGGIAALFGARPAFAVGAAGSFVIALAMWFKLAAVEGVPPDDAPPHQKSTISDAALTTSGPRS